MNSREIARLLAPFMIAFAASVPGQAEPPGSERLPGRDSDTRYTFKSNTARYLLADSRALELARELAKTKPKYGPVGFHPLGANWAVVEIMQEGKPGPDHLRYVACVRNVFTGRKDFAFSPTVIVLNEVTVRSGVSHTRLLGGYRDPKLWSRLVTGVCKEASIEMPKELSNEEQMAPPARAYQGIIGKAEFQKVAETAKSAKPATPAVAIKPWVTVSVSAAVDLLGKETIYDVDVFKTPGLMRVALRIGPTSTDLGVVSDVTVWRMLCEKSCDGGATSADTTIRTERSKPAAGTEPSTGKVEPSNNSSSAARHPPDGQPPTEPEPASE